MSAVLVTGGSGFVGSRLVLQLLAAGHTVHTTVRSLNREDDVRSMLRDAGANPGSELAFFAADLERDDGWAKVVEGCDHVMRVASPMPQTAPKSEDELIIPARDAKIKRVVVSSTCGAIYYGHLPRQTPFDETSWTNLDGEMSAYAKSKAIAERAAWDFMAAEGDVLELAMINSAAQGERFIAVSGEAMSMLDIARLLKARLGDAAKKVPTRQLPDWLVRLIARFDPGMRQLLPPLGTIRNASSAKAERVLGRTPRSKEDAITATAESLLKFGIVG